MQVQYVHAHLWKRVIREAKRYHAHTPPAYINDKQENTPIIHYRDIFINSYCRFLVGIINKKDLKIFPFSIQRRLFLSVVVFLISRQPHEGQPCLVGQPEGQPLHHAEDEPGDQLAVLVEDIRRVVPHGGLHDRVVAGVRDLGQRRRGEGRHKLVATLVKVAAVQGPLRAAEALLHGLVEGLLAGAEFGLERRISRIYQYDLKGEETSSSDRMKRELVKTKL